MALIPWREDFNVGIVMVDQQHRQLVSILNHLHEVMKNGSHPIDVQTVLSELTSYTRFHFTAEEKLMAECGYPAREEHIRKHRAMVARVGDFVEEMRFNSATTPPKLLNFLKEWLTRHILETDREMAQFCSRTLQAR